MGGGSNGGKTTDTEGDPLFGQIDVGKEEGLNQFALNGVCHSFQAIVSP